MGNFGPIWRPQNKILVILGSIPPLFAAKKGLIALYLGTMGQIINIQYWWGPLKATSGGQTHFGCKMGEIVPLMTKILLLGLKMVALDNYYSHNYTSCDLLPFN